MTSKTKFPVTEEQVREIVRRAHLGEVQSVAVCPDGWYNNVLSVAANGVEYILKIAPEPSLRVLTHERELLRQELRFIALLQERTKIRVPKVFFEDSSKSVIPCDYFIMEKFRGQRLDKAKLQGEAKQRAEAQIDAILEQFHGIAGEGFGYEQMGLQPNWHLALRAMVQALVDDCAGFGRRCRVGERLLRYIALHREILEAVPSVLVNSDLHKGNLFLEGDGLAVIDLERCYWGDWIGDCLLSGLPQGATPEEQIRFALLNGYAATVMYTEKFSRYKPWNQTWWLDVAGTIYFGRKSFHALRRLER